MSIFTRRRRIICLIGFSILAIILLLHIKQNLVTETFRHKVAQPYPGSVTQHIRIAFLADMHTGINETEYQALEQLVRSVNLEEVDLVLLGGDYTQRLDPTTDNQTHIDKISGILAKMGGIPIVAVSGNYEYDAAPDKWRKTLLENEITALENSSTRILTKNGPVCIRGFGDSFSGKFQYKDFPEDCRYLPRLTLTHDPAGAFHPKIEGLIFAGHTHCGQISLPWIGPLWVPSEAPTDATCGWYHDDQRLLFVSAGIGHSILPIRIGTQSSWDVFDITFRPQ